MDLRAQLNSPNDCRMRALVIPLPPYYLSVILAAALSNAFPLALYDIELRGIAMCNLCHRSWCALRWSSNIRTARGRPWREGYIA